MAGSTITTENRKEEAEMEELHRERIRAILAHLAQEEVWSFVSEKPHGFYPEPIRKMTAEISFESTESPHVAAKLALAAFEEIIKK